MKKAFYVRLLIICSVAILGAYVIVRACAGGDWSSNYYSRYTPEVFVDLKYKPMFLDVESPYYDYDYENNMTKRFTKDVCSSWLNYFDGELDSAAISSMLFDGNEFTGEYFRRQLKISSLSKKERMFYSYMCVARSVEAACLREPLGWRDDYESPMLSDDNIIHKALDFYKNAETDFVRKRAWFLVVKTLFYSEGKEQDLIDFFAKTSSDLKKDQLYYRALSYTAGAYYRQEDYSNSNFRYAQVFQHCPELMKSCIFSYHPQGLDNFERNTLSLATSTNDKCALWALQGYYTDEVDALIGISKIDINNDLNKLILSRIVNISEPSSIGISYKKEEYASNLEDIIKKIEDNVDIKSAKDQFIWNASLGYLNTISKKYNRADEYFAKAEKAVPATQTAKDQLRILNFTNKMCKIKSPNEAELVEVLDDLEWLNIGSKNDISDIRKNYVIDWTREYLHQLYSKSGDKIMAELFAETWKAGSRDFYDSEELVNAMIAFLRKKNKSRIELVAMKNYVESSDPKTSIRSLQEYQSIQALYANKLEDMPIPLSGKLLANPFNNSIQDNHDKEHAKKKTYAKERLVSTIKLMKEKVAKGEDLYNNSLLLGNAFYSISHYGNCRLYVSCFVGYFDSPSSFRESMKRMITDCSVAKKYYQQAFDAATNNEQRAECAYMIAKCERNEYYNENFIDESYYWSISNNDTPDFLEWNGFKTLKQYSETKYYQQVINECGYFKKCVD
ncbi:MAG: hypothetical protein ACK5IQ_09530 [Bacteroidales bacterium]